MHKEKECPRCNGRGQTKHGSTYQTAGKCCSKCRGSGEVFIINPDKKRANK